MSAVCHNAMLMSAVCHNAMLMSAVCHNAMLIGADARGRAAVITVHIDMMV